MDEPKVEQPYARYKCNEELECLRVSTVIVPGSGQFVASIGKD